MRKAGQIDRERPLRYTVTSARNSTMIQEQMSMLDVADNSGAKRVHVHQGAGGNVDDATPPSVTSSLRPSRRRIPNGEVKSGQVVKGVIVRTSKAVCAANDGTYIRFDTQRHGRHRSTDNGNPKWHPHLRRRRSRVARQELHEDRLAGGGGRLMVRIAPNVKKGDKVVVISGADKSDEAQERDTGGRRTRLAPGHRRRR